MPTWREIKGGYGRGRRALRRAMLEPLLVGRPVLRDTVMHALAARGHFVFCDLGDARFFVDPSDRVVGAWLMWHGGWQRREIDQAIAVLAASGRLVPDAEFVDVGANIGTHTVYAMRTGRFGRAVAFEPEPKNARLLRMNIEANGLAERVTVIEKAAGEQEGAATLYLHPRNKGAHAIGSPPSDDGLDRLEVPVVRVEAMLGDLGLTAAQIGLVWIDAEGHEPQIIRGLGRLLDERVPLAFEFAPHRYDPAARRGLIDLLAARYTTLHSLNASPDHRAPIAALADIGGMDDVLVF